MAIQKSFKLREVATLSIRAESFNLFNRANFYNPISSYSLDGVSQNSQFGQINVGAQSPPVSIFRPAELVARH